MEYYCIMVLTGEEKKFKERVLKEFKETNPETKFYFFERKMKTKRRGWFIGTLFPSYLFFGVEELNTDFSEKEYELCNEIFKEVTKKWN